LSLSSWPLVEGWPAGTPLLWTNITSVQ